MFRADHSIFLSGFTSAFSDETACLIDQADQAPSFEGPQRISLDIAPSELAETAVRRTLELCNLDVAALDLVISCTQTPDYNNPGLAGFLLKRLESVSAPGLELKLSAAAPLHAVEIARRMIESGKLSCVLVVGCDLLSRYFLQAADHPLASRYGDGAGSLIVSTSEVAAKSRGAVLKLLDARTGLLARGRDAETIAAPASCQFPQRITAKDLAGRSNLPRLDGGAFMKTVAGDGARSLDQWYSLAGAGEISYLAMHSPIGIELGAALECRARFPAARVSDPSFTQGYIGAAGIPVALSAIARHIKSSDRIVATAFGSGINFGFMLAEAA